MKTAFMLIATGGEHYMQYVPPLMESLKKFFPPHEVVLFTDSDAHYDRCWKVFQPNLGWPRATLMRYHAMLGAEDLLSSYDQLFYMDIDMLMVNPVAGEEIWSNGITAVTHPGYPNSFERRPQSRACVVGDHPYYQGCFQGGDSKAFLEMCRVLARNIDIDLANLGGDKPWAIWHDESHMNRYLLDHPPAKVLTPAYCLPIEKYLVHPERWQTPGWVPKILHIEKVNQGEWKNAHH
jgi:histo-blood group ABO system transferase